MPITEEQVDRIRDLARNFISRDKRAQEVGLVLRGDRLDDGFLYLCVAPTREGISPVDYADSMRGIETAIAEQGYNDEDLLVVPIAED